MNYMDGITGKLLTEEAMIGSNVKTIKLSGDVYDLTRTLLYIVNPDNYVDNSSIGEGGFMCFYTDEEYDRTTKLLKQFGLKYADTSINNSKNDDDEGYTGDVKSPYPSNTNILEPEL